MALEAHDELDLMVAAAPTSLEPGIATVPLAEFSRSRELRNRSLGRIVWQQGALRLALISDADVYIFVGSANYLSTWAAAALCRVRGKRVLFWTIGWHRRDVGTRRWIRRVFYSLAHELLLYGSWGREYGLQAGHPRSRMRVVGNSVSTPPAVDEPPVGELKELTKARLVIGGVARMTRVKGFDLVLRAANELRGAGIDCRVLLVGDGEDVPKLRALARDLQVPTTFVGARYGVQALADVYSRLDLTVIPGAIGLTAVQSLSFGVPVVTGNERSAQMPEAESVIDGVTGLLFDPRKPRSLTSALQHFLDLTPGERETMRAAARSEVATHWSASATARKIGAACLTCREDVEA